MLYEIPENKKKDFPSKFPIGPDPLSPEKLNRSLAEELSNWKIISPPLPEDFTSQRTELFREYLFEEFDNVIEYIVKVAVGFNILPHHPRWVNAWASLRVYLITWHKTHIISYKDIMLDRYMDKVYLKYANFGANIHTRARVQTEKGNFKTKIGQDILYKTAQPYNH